MASTKSSSPSTLPGTSKDKEDDEHNLSNVQMPTELDVDNVKGEKLMAAICGFSATMAAHLEMIVKTAMHMNYEEKSKQRLKNKQAASLLAVPRHQSASNVTAGYNPMSPSIRNVGSNGPTPGRNDMKRYSLDAASAAALIRGGIGAGNRFDRRSSFLATGSTAGNNNQNNGGKAVLEWTNNPLKDNAPGNGTNANAHRQARGASTSGRGIVAESPVDRMHRRRSSTRDGELTNRSRSNTGISNISNADIALLASSAQDVRFSSMLEPRIPSSNAAYGAPNASTSQRSNRVRRSSVSTITGTEISHKSAEDEEEEEEDSETDDDSDDQEMNSSVGGYSDENFAQKAGSIFSRRELGEGGLKFIAQIRQTQMFSNYTFVQGQRKRAIKSAQKGLHDSSFIDLLNGSPTPEVTPDKTIGNMPALSGLHPQVVYQHSLLTRLFLPY